MKHYPSSSKARFTDNIRALFNFSASKAQLQNAPLIAEPLTRIQDSYLEAQIRDHWQNEVANLSANNSLTQHTKFILNRIPYQQLAMLASDDIISNAIETITRESLAQWGTIEVKSDSQENDTESVREWLESRLIDLDFQSTLAEAIRKSLIYGGSFIYFAYSGEQDLSKPLILSKETSINKIQFTKVIEAWQASPASVDLNNPTSKDYMKPSAWYIQGAGNVDSSRIYSLVFFDAPDLIKPMFNFLGISLAQFMQDKVKSADGMRQALADIFLRFRTNIIRTPSLISMDKDTLKQRVELINMGINNFSTLLLTDSENFEQSITPLSGLDKIYAQAQESIASSARIPINKLFGQTPTGLNNSGNYDIENFYDIIKGYQESTLKPLIMHTLKLLLNERVEQGLRATFTFNPLEKLNDLELAQVKNTEADFYTKLISAGIITQDEALQELKAKGYLSADIQGDSASDDIDLDSELDLNLESLQDSALKFSDYFSAPNKIAGTKYSSVSENGLMDLNQGIKPLEAHNEKDCAIVEKALGLKKNSVKQETLRNFLQEAHDLQTQNKLWHHMGNGNEVNFYDLGNLLTNVNEYSPKEHKIKQDLFKKHFGKEMDYSNINKLAEINKDIKGLALENSLKENYNTDIINANNPNLSHYNRQEALNTLKYKLNNYNISQDLKESTNAKLDKAQSDIKQAKQRAEQEYQARQNAQYSEQNTKNQKDLNKLKDRINKMDRMHQPEHINNHREKLQNNIESLKRKAHAQKNDSYMAEIEKMQAELDNKYKERKAELESGGSSEWQERLHPRNPDESFKSK